MQRPKRINRGQLRNLLERKARIRRQVGFRTTPGIRGRRQTGTVVPSMLTTNPNKAIGGKKDIRQTSQVLEMNGINSPFPTRTLTSHTHTQDIMLTNVPAFGFSRIYINRMHEPFAALGTNPLDVNQYFFPNTLPKSPQGASYFIGPSSADKPYRRYQVHKFKCRLEVMNSDPKDHGRIFLSPIGSRQAIFGLATDAETVINDLMNSALTKWNDWQAYANKKAPAVQYNLNVNDLEGISKAEYNSESDFYGSGVGDPALINYMYWGYTNDTQAASSEAPITFRISCKWYVEYFDGAQAVNTTGNVIQS